MKRAAVVALALIFIIAACGSDPFDLEIGMSIDDMLDIMGEPGDMYSSFTGDVVWLWDTNSDNEHDKQVKTRDGRIRIIDLYYRSP
jgi:hypothetical protein